MPPARPVAKPEQLLAAKWFLKCAPLLIYALESFSPKATGARSSIGKKSKGQGAALMQYFPHIIRQICWDKEYRLR
jgi:hypothetical protein